jgi:hypothetical protein
MRLKGTFTGCNIRKKELLKNSTPTTNIAPANSNAVRYSILPYPKGCLSSAGRLESLKLIIVTKDDSASVRLWKASAVIAILFRSNPITSSIIRIEELIIIPTFPPSEP